MISNATPWMYEHALYNGVATQSLRFDDGSSAHLTRTPSASNRKTYTWSGWVKRGATDTTGQQALFSAGTPTLFTMFYINKSTATRPDTILFYDYDGTTDYGLELAIRLRDSSSWYHLVCSVDTTQGTPANRLKIYVNGVQQSDKVADYGDLPLNHDTIINNNVNHYIGRYSSNSQYFDGYMAEVNFVDGTQLDPTSFGETKNGVWIAKKYTGSYGTNGYRLEFKNTSVGSGSSSTIGADTSGNTHHFTSSGIVASDCNMPDSPENNFCTYNPLYSWATTNTTLSEGNLKSTETGTTFGVKGIGTIAVNSGKWYFETHPYLMGNANHANIGVIDVSSMTTTNGTGSDTGKFKAICYASYQGRKSAYGTGVDSNITLDGIGQSSYGDSWGASDIIGVALDIDNDAIYFSKNGTWQNSATSAEISAGTTTNSAYTGKLSGLTWTVAQGNGLNANNFGFILNAGQDSSFAGNKTAQGNTDGNGIGDFYYEPPSGFLALCSANLPEPTIGGISSTLPTDYFNTVLYTGNGGTQAITGVGFQPDWFWGKRRDSVGGHALYDTTRGATKELASHSNGAEITESNGLTSFDSDGFTLGSDGRLNTSSSTNVAWNWKANGGTTSSNTDGSITSTVQANTDAGFSIVTYNIGSSGAKTIGHGLTKAPEIIFNKGRDQNAAWWTFTTVIDGTLDYLRLDGTNAKANDTLLSLPSSTTFGMVENYTLQQNAIAYCFHSVEGYSKIGTFTGNGNADGTFVYTGFRPAWVMIKQTSASGNSWHIIDNKRIGYNERNDVLLADDTASEQTNYNVQERDLLSNGFKMRDSNAGTNANGSTYIYMAFAEAPFKYANAR